MINWLIKAPQEAYERYVGGNFRHHNPYFRGDAKSLQTAMAENAAKNPNKKVDIQFALQEGSALPYSHESSRTLANAALPQFTYSASREFASRSSGMLDRRFRQRT